ncbi:MAG: hypothetical protein KatS3mg010_0562 [Acidimicrobiia bacterium]|nr:MAG: hypothetical protein KatS3mg010_0562 [Acidimicrobiia bacterium]
MKSTRVMQPATISGTRNENILTMWLWMSPWNLMSSA